jgi:hypothetical protein
MVEIGLLDVVEIGEYALCLFARDKGTGVELGMKGGMKRGKRLRSS